MAVSDVLGVIPFYKNQEQLTRCLAHLEKQTRKIEPFVHDNTVDNIGFTRAVNLGFRKALRAGNQYVITLNQDVYLEPDAVEAVCAFMDRTPACAIAGIQQRASIDTDFIIHAGCTMAYPTGVHVSGRASAGVGKESAKMPWVNGAVLAARIEALYDIGVMDENMFLFGSDSDWCYTARARNWEVWYCAEARCVHEVGASNKPTEHSIGHFSRDMAYWRDKWVGTPLFRRLNEAFQLGSLNFG